MKNIKLFHFIFVSVFLVFLISNHSDAQTATENEKYKNKTMNHSVTKTDKEVLSELNARFIKNFINEDVNAHEEIIYKDFVYIESNGAIVPRDV